MVKLLSRYHTSTLVRKVSIAQIRLFAIDQASLKLLGRLSDGIHELTYVHVTIQ